MNNKELYAILSKELDKMKEKIKVLSDKIGKISKLKNKGNG